MEKNNEKESIKTERRGRPPKPKSEIDTKGTKGRRGRPPGKKGDSIIEQKREGIVTKVKSDKCLILLKYSETLLFKKIFEFISSINCEVISFKFLQDGLKICGINNTGQVHFNIWFDGNKMDQYYCSKQTTVNINMATILANTKSITANYISVQLAMMIQQDIVGQNLFLLKEISSQLTEKVPFSLSNNEIIYPDIVMDENFALAFTLNLVTFKNLTQDRIKNVPKLTFKKNPDGSILIESIIGSVLSQSFIKNEPDVNIISKIKNNEYLNVSISVSILNNINQLREIKNVRFFLYYEKFHLLMVELDNSSIIVTYKINQ